jgi:hypothetical protein
MDWLDYAIEKYALYPRGPGEVGVIDSIINPN